jgi:hypothetical protein
MRSVPTPRATSKLLGTTGMGSSVDTNMTTVIDTAANTEAAIATVDSKSEEAGAAEHYHQESRLQRSAQLLNGNNLIRERRHAFLLKRAKGERLNLVKKGNSLLHLVGKLEARSMTMVEQKEKLTGRVLGSFGENL